MKLLPGFEREYLPPVRHRLDRRPHVFEWSRHVDVGRLNLLVSHQVADGEQIRKGPRLEAISEDFGGILFDNKFLISKSSIPQAPALLRAWYIQKAGEKITPQVKFYAKHLGVSFNNILISDLKYRWGSCTPRNNLNFNWRLIKAPMRVIEYVIVHELAHLLEPNHTAHFWAIVKTQLPDYLKAKEWLKQSGALLEESP